MTLGTRALTGDLQTFYDKISRGYRLCERKHAKFVRMESDFLSGRFYGPTLENYYGQREPQLRDLVSYVSKVHLAARELSKKICKERVVNSRYQGTVNDISKKCQVIIDSSQRLASKMISYHSVKAFYDRMSGPRLLLHPNEPCRSGSRSAIAALRTEYAKIYEEHNGYLKEYCDFVKNEATYLSNKPAYITSDAYEEERENRLKDLAERISRLLNRTIDFEERVRCTRVPNNSYKDELRVGQVRSFALVGSQRRILSDLLAKSKHAKDVLKKINEDPFRVLRPFIMEEYVLTGRIVNIR